MHNSRLVSRSLRIEYIYSDLKLPQVECGRAVEKLVYICKIKAFEGLSFMSSFQASYVGLFLREWSQLKFCTREPFTC